jgi:predicted nucleic acid-binding protein
LTGKSEACRSDARIAASMYVHGVSQLLTINVRDFQRFPLLSAVRPSEIVHPAL